MAVKVKPEGGRVTPCPFLIRITEAEDARMNKEWRRDYMTLEMLKQDCREEGIQIGEQKGREEGDASRQEKVVVNMLKAGMEEAVIANIAELSIAEVQKIKKKHNL